MTEPSKQVNPWLSGADFEIAPVGQAVGAGIGYMLSPTAAGDMLGQAEDALKDLNAIKVNAVNLKAVQPPAKDPASVAYNARLANGSGAFDAGVSHIDTEIAYLNELISKIKEAFKKITGHEATAATEVNNTGAGIGVPQTPPSKGGTVG